MRDLQKSPDIGNTDIDAPHGPPLALEE